MNAYPPASSVRARSLSTGLAAAEEGTPSELVRRARGKHPGPKRRGAVDDGKMLAVRRSANRRLASQRHTRAGAHVRILPNGEQSYTLY